MSSASRSRGSLARLPSLQVTVPAGDPPGGAEQDGRLPLVKPASAPASPANGAPASPQRRGEASSGFHSCTGTAQNPDQAAAILRGFKLFRDLDVGVHSMLPKIAHFISCAAGTVLFRQGDAPGSCYVVLGGELGIFVLAEEEAQEAKGRGGEGKPPTPVRKTRERGEGPPPTPPQRSAPGSPEARRSLQASPQARRSELAEPTDPARKSLAETQRRSQLSARFEPQQASPSESPRAPKAQHVGDLLLGQRTVDGFSYYHPTDNLGNKVAEVGRGHLVGELALLNDQQRTASVKCLVDCELLAIRRTDFDRVLKVHMLRQGDEKLRFLMEHVPGMADVAAPKPGTKPHASYYFRKGHFPRGHTFLEQGALADPPSIYVVWSGAVEFVRVDHRVDKSKLPSGPEAVERLLNSRKAEKPAMRRQSRSQPRLGSAPADLHCGDGTKGPVTNRRGVLVAGGVFGSMPISEPEPFTVRVHAGGPCEVLFVQGGDFSKLPRRLLEACREYVANATAWRLVCHKGSLDFRGRVGQDARGSLGAHGAPDAGADARAAGADARAAGEQRSGQEPSLAGFADSRSSLEQASLCGSSQASLGRQSLRGTRRGQGWRRPASRPRAGPP